MPSWIQLFAMRSRCTCPYKNNQNAFAVNFQIKIQSGQKRKPVCFAASYKKIYCFIESNGSDQAYAICPSLKIFLVALELFLELAKNASRSRRQNYFDCFEMTQFSFASNRFLREYLATYYKVLMWWSFWRNACKIISVVVAAVFSQEPPPSEWIRFYFAILHCSNKFMYFVLTYFKTLYSVD